MCGNGKCIYYGCNYCYALIVADEVTSEDGTYCSEECRDLDAEIIDSFYDGTV